MILKNLLFVVCLSLLSSLLPAQKGNTDYNAAWKRIDSLIDQKGLPKSALIEVNHLYAAAKKEKNEAQVIRALIFRMNLESNGQEDSIKSAIKELEEETANAQEPARSVLESLLARAYLNYYRSNRWKIYDRTKTRDIIKEDIATWDAADFNRKIGDLYLASLKEKSLLYGTRLDAFDPILVKGNVRSLRPTLFDLLAHQALDYFKGDEQDLDRPASAFVIDDSLVFADARVFASHHFDSSDSLSLHLRALQLFQELTRLHLPDADPHPLLDLEIERSQFADLYAVMDNKEELYMRSLVALTDRFPNDPIGAKAWYLQALQWTERAGRYRPLEEETDRYANLKAVEICKKVIAGKDSSEGRTNCQVLLQNILRKEIALRIEKINLPGQPMRSLLTWRNFSSIHIRLIPLDNLLKQNLGNNQWDDEYWRKLIMAPVFSRFSQALPQTGDYQSHRTELKLDGLPPGEYALLASDADGFSIDSNALAVQFFYVSSIAYITHDRDFFVLNRESGQPLAGASVQVWKQNYDAQNGRYMPVKAKIYQTDMHGHILLEEDGYDKIVAGQLYEISINGDHLFTDDLHRAYYRNGIRSSYQQAAGKVNYDPGDRRTFFFTDRSIYRPGQTIYFKAILTARDHQRGRSVILPQFETKLILYNTNHEKVDSLTLTSNEFGSVHGHFILPEHQLNGSFTIQEDSTGSQQSFSVEEYKRPNFYVDYEKLKGSHRPGDSIQVRGAAKAYAGNNIGGAIVKYRVQRQVRFPNYWRSFRGPGPNSQVQEIAHGVTQTGADGSFNVDFVALPDRSVNRNLDPFFDYTVSADVTDINGETRSKTTIVAVGYKVLSLSIGEPEGGRLAADSLKTISVRANNLSGEPVPAIISLSIYSLKAPQRLIRQREWEEPDQFVIDSGTYLRYFPRDEYSNETKKEGWGKKEEVFHSLISPDEGGEGYDLHGLKFAPGWYLVEVKTTDKYGQEVTGRRWLELYNGSTGQPATPQYEWTAGQEKTVEPGEEAKIVTGSSARDLFVMREIESSSKKRKQDSSRLSYYTLNDEWKSSTFPITEADRGGFQIADVFIKDNRFHTVFHPINVPWTNKQLSISYASYRDKTLPGSEEKWQVRIKGYKGDQVAAEVLAGMYDASLDQFQPHGWYKPNLYLVNQPASAWDPMNDFYAVGSTEKYRNPAPVKTFINLYDQLLPDLYQFGYAPYRGNRIQALTRSSSAPMNFNLPAPTPGVALKKITVRGTASITQTTDDFLTIIDGVLSPASALHDLLPANIQSVTIIKGQEAVSLYGANAANGVIAIITKQGALKNAEQELQTRRNLVETAFFFPDLQTDSTGTATFSFTMPDALTRWKWMTLAHTKDLAFGYSEKSVITQKQLMVQPNAPRFLRQNDRMILSAKIANLSGAELRGRVELQLTDATSGLAVNAPFGNLVPDQAFIIRTGQSLAVSFPIRIPDHFNRPVTYRIVARAAAPAPATATGGAGSGETFSDGEEATLPVLSNRMLVTESLPLNMRGDGTRRFKFGKLLQSGSDQTLIHHALTVEFSSNPAWYVVQALPYLMEYPYDCAEQDFDRFYANSLAAMIVNSSPRVKAVFEKWKTADTAALLSNLEKNQELKSVLLEETPWVLQGKSESAQKKNIALLFDMSRMSRELANTLSKLKDLQNPDGSFAWFKGGPADRYITQYILTGIGRLQKLNALPAGSTGQVKIIVDAALSYLDGKIIEDYEELKKWAARIQAEAKNNTPILLEEQIPGVFQVQYLYMRSFFADRGIPGGVLPAISLYRKQAQHAWPTLSKYMQGMIALALYRTGDIQTGKNIIASLRENAIRDLSDGGKGMYWGNTGGYYWYEAPIERQALLIEAFGEISHDAGIDRDLKTWLLRQKQTHNWATTKATADACYALLMTGDSWLQTERKVNIRLGDKTVSSDDEQRSGSEATGGEVPGGEAGTGYFKKVFDGGEVDSSMGNITVTLSSKPIAGNPSASVPRKPALQNSPPAWGAVYWQYFENLDKIVPPDDRPVVLKLTKKLFVEKNTDRGPVLEPINERDSLNVGDKIKIRIELQVDRDLEYVHMKDMRAACMEPVNVLSQYKWQGGLGYYESTKDVATDLFFSWLPHGTYVFEYPVFVGQAGDFSNGITNIECMYAPEFSFHSEGIRVHVRAAGQ